MTTLDRQLDEKQTVVNGKMTQAKGVVREQWGNLQNDELTRLAGKKDQVVGRLQANYGNSWFMHPQNWILIGTAVAVFGAALAFLFSRNSTEDTEES